MIFFSHFLALCWRATCVVDSIWLCPSHEKGAFRIDSTAINYNAVRYLFFSSDSNMRRRPACFDKIGRTDA